MTHPTDPVAAMREACAKACREEAKRVMSLYDGDPMATKFRAHYADGAYACADRIAALPLPACATGDDAAHGEGAKPGEASRRATEFVAAMDNSPCPHTEADYCESDCGYCLAAALDRFAATVPTPAPSRPADDAVARARERVTEAMRKWMAADRAAKAPPFVHLSQKEWSALWWELNDAYDALLAAELAASDEKGG